MKNDKMLNCKISKSKKGTNDISILGIILSIFFLTALIIPFINDEFGTGYAEYNADGELVELRDNAGSTSSVNPFNIFVTMLKLSVWDFGNSLGLPVWIDIVYTILAILFMLIIARNIWVGGGA